MRNLVLAITIISAVLTQAGEKNGSGIDADVAEILGGDVAVKVLRDAESAHASLQPAKSHHQADVSQYKTRFGPVPLSEEHREQMMTLLLSRKSYLIGVGKGCEPDYGVRVTFKNGDKVVDILFCFGCEQLQTYVNGKSTSGGLFDPSAKDFAKLMQQIFPEDKAIQSLK